MLVVPWLGVAADVTASPVYVGGGLSDITASPVEGWVRPVGYYRQRCGCWVRPGG
jgi:hypothetical protein